MNSDNPDSRVFHELMGAMYRNHPVREEILGSRESIAQITPETLYKVHEAFYQPSNMLLCVVGDVDPQQVRRIALEALPKNPGPPVEATRSWQEDMTCAQACVHTTMEVAMPTFQLGFKCEPLGNGPEAIRQELVGDLAAEALFGESSALYLRLYEEGLIDSSFGGGFETVEGMSILTASGDSNDPEAVQAAILAQAKVLAQQGVADTDFLRMKRSALGRRIRGLDSFDSVCFRICAYYFSGFDYFLFPAVYQDVQAAEIQAFLQRFVTEERMSLSVIYPPSE